MPRLHKETNDAPEHWGPGFVRSGVGTSGRPEVVQEATRTASYLFNSVVRVIKPTRDTSGYCHLSCLFYVLSHVSGLSLCMTTWGHWAAFPRREAGSQFRSDTAEAEKIEFSSPQGTPPLKFQHSRKQKKISLFCKCM